MAVEEAAYRVEQENGSFEVRFYAPQVVAEVSVEGTLEDAGNTAFRPLFRYISGDNRRTDKIPMTAPVSQQAENQKIPMTAPVSQQSDGQRWSVSFMMPAGSTLESLPRPTDPKVRLRAIPAQRMAAVRYRGTWSQSRYERHLNDLRNWMKANQLKAIGEPVWARYNPPFTPWFLRRNEILIPVETPPRP